jgi:3-oxoacyl-[acyl-carrier protein] reductase
MDLGIQGRIALVGASGRGLGRATAEHLAKEAVRVALCDKDGSALDKARAAVSQAGGGSEVRAYAVDLTQPDDIHRLVADVHLDLGPISILVTNPAARRLVASMTPATKSGRRPTG